MQIEKTLYDMLRAALLFYRKLRTDLEDMGFEVNPYDPFVANKIVHGSQCTAVWHVGDLKVSHKDEAVVLNVLHTRLGPLEPGQRSRSREERYLTTSGIWAWILTLSRVQVL